MKFSYNWLKKYIDLKLSPEKLAEQLTLHSFETNVIKNGKETMLDVDVLPNRSHDCFSHYGLAKEIALLTKKRVKKINIDYKRVNKKEAVLVDIKEKNSCSRYMAQVLDNVKIAPSPAWLKNTLLSFNIKPHNNIVDILNYVMLEVGQPMHAFDRDKLEMGKIIIRRAKKGEKINTLDGDKYDLNENVLVIADGEKPVAIAGIKGGLETGVSKETKRVVIESANFEPSSIRQTSRILGLNTDAAIRFSCGLDPNLTEFGLNRACALIQEIVPGVEIVESNVDVYIKRFLPKVIKLNLKYLNNLIGADIKPEFVRKTLESLGAKTKIAGKGLFLVTAPTIRLDLEREEDLIEEVGRIYGYTNLKSAMPVGALAFPKQNDVNLFSNKVRDILTGVGFNEAYNYSFISEKDAGENEKKKLAEIQNPTSEDFKYLRPELVLNLLKNVKNNFRFFGKIKFFELGKVFAKSDSDTKYRNRVSMPLEILRLCGVYAEKKDDEKSAKERFFEMKGVLSVLFENLGISDISYKPAVGQWWHPGRVANIEHGEDFLGVIGEINPLTMATLGISGRAAMFDLDFEKLVEIAEEEREFSPISKYPAVIRDIAVLVDRKTRVSEVLNVIYSSGAELVEDVDLFDYYEGPSTGSLLGPEGPSGPRTAGQAFPEDKKSLAFHIVYSADHTLIDKEVGREEEKIKNALIKELNAEIR